MVQGYTAMSPSPVNTTPVAQPSEMNEKEKGHLRIRIKVPKAAFLPSQESKELTFSTDLTSPPLPELPSLLFPSDKATSLPSQKRKRSSHLLQPDKVQDLPSKRGHKRKRSSHFSSPAVAGSRPARQLRSSEKMVLTISLSRKEISEDFRLMTGKNLPKNPTRRPWKIPRDIVNLCPGKGLEGLQITASRYTTRKG